MEHCALFSTVIKTVMLLQFTPLTVFFLIRKNMNRDKKLKTDGHHIRMSLIFLRIILKEKTRIEALLGSGCCVAVPH